jgi:hypothetical protein
MANGKRSAVRWMGFGLGAVCALSPLAAYAGPADVYYERAVMIAADQRCGLFSPALGSALAASTAQARGAALRSGFAADQLSQVKERARTAASGADCRSNDINMAAGRVRSAFQAYSRQLKMAYPGSVAGWNAERITSATSQVWNLAQRPSFGADSLTVGLAGRVGANSLTAMTRFADGATPYAARIVVRDTTRAPAPYLDLKKVVNGQLPLSATIAPAYAKRTWFAETRGPADAMLVSAAGQLSTKGYVAWRFPPAAAEALANLDPREAVEVEFLFNGPTGDVVRRAYVEVGDFAAGKAFVSMVQR